jgi:flavin-dependent dehydrogenase
MIEKDVLIVGGGPAGSACAWRLRQHGLDALILDKAEFPRQKPCAGWVTPSLFRALNISPEDYPKGLTQFSSFQVSIKGIKFRLPTRQYAIRRWEFDNWMLARSGVDHEVHQVHVINREDDTFIVDDQYAAKFIVGAGGTHCPVRRAFFSDTPTAKEPTLIVAKEEEFQTPIQDHRCYLWFFEDGLPGYAWYVPKTGGWLNVGIGGAAAGLKKNSQTLNQHWDRLVDKLATMGLVNDHKFHPAGHSYLLRPNPLTGRLGNALLAGDSLGLATLDMGEGIGPAIQSGILAADAIATGGNYSLNSIPKYSFPSLLRLRK